MCSHIQSHGWLCTRAKLQGVHIAARLQGKMLSLLCCFLEQISHGFLHTEHQRTAYMQAKNILIATGGRATVPPIEGKEHTIISDQVLDLPKKPNK